MSVPVIIGGVLGAGALAGAAGLFLSSKSAEKEREAEQLRAREEELRRLEREQQAATQAQQAAVNNALLAQLAELQAVANAPPPAPVYVQQPSPQPAPAPVPSGGDWIDDVGRLFGIGTQLLGTLGGIKLGP